MIQVKKNFKILAVDDDNSILLYIKFQLEKENYKVETTDDTDKVLSLAQKKKYDVIITDLYMPKMSGVEILKEIKKISPQTKVIVMTGSSEVSDSIRTMKEGAYDYLLKPVSPQLLLLRIEYLYTLKEQTKQTKTLRSLLESQYRFNNIIGRSKPMQTVFEKIQMVADSPATVIIQGASGTGKEMISNALHYNSSRRDNAFIKVSCGIFNMEILESELFGHEKGSFTGALRQKIGRFELANKGTIFLDDIDDIPIATQVKLLRILQEREFERVGGEKTIKVDVRVIAATKKDLRQLVDEKKFREDLYYRLNVIPIVLPPLNKRKEDIPLLVSFFIKKYSQKKISSELNEEVLKLILEYPWPGNVRELENAVEHAITFCKTNQIEVCHFPEKIIKDCKTIINRIDLDMPEGDIDFNCMVSDFEKKLLHWALGRTKGHQTKMAKMLGLPRTTLRDKLIRHDIVNNE